MSTIAPPPQDTFQSATPEVAGALDDFSKRISELEASREYQALTIEAQYKELLKNEIQQRMEIRWQVIVIAIVVLVFMGFILAHGAHTFAQKDISGMPASLLIAMFVAPIVSISTISVMLLFGAFRQFKDEDIKNVNIPSLAGEALKSGAGN